MVLAPPEPLGIENWEGHASPKFTKIVFWLMHLGACLTSFSVVRSKFHLSFLGFRHELGFISVNCLPNSINEEKKQQENTSYEQRLQSIYSKRVDFDQLYL